MWGHYRRCVQRHLYARQGTAPKRTYLSKNPTFTLRLRSLLREFPDAHVVVLVRDPERHLPGWEHVGVH